MLHVNDWRLLTGVVVLATSAPLFAQPPQGKEYYQDFRGNKPLIDELEFFGEDADTVRKAEDAGLRFTFAAKRKWKGPLGVETAIPLTGDFEITGSYELLTIERPPPGGPGVGVALNLANLPDYQNFAKLGRFMLAKHGNVHLAEAWHRDLPKDNPLGVWKTEATEAKSGQIRLKREDKLLRYLVAEGPGDKFLELESREFNDRDVKFVRFLVTNNGSPALIDARLLDLRIRTGTAPNGAGAPAAPKGPPGGGGMGATMIVAQSGAYLMIIVFAGITVIFLAVAILGGWLVLRARAKKSAVAIQSPQPDAAVTISFACSSCNKQLKAKPENAGKKIKCPHCNNAMLVPVTDTNIKPAK